MINLSVISFTNLRDLPFLLGTIMSSGVLAHLMRKGLSPCGKLQRYLKERAWKSRNSKFNRVAKILKDPFLRKELECCLKISTGNISEAKEEILSLEHTIQEFLSRTTFQDDDGFKVGNTYPQMVGTAVGLTYAIFLYVIALFPFFFSKEWSPFFISSLTIFALIDVRFLVVKYGKGKSVNIISRVQQFFDNQSLPTSVKSEQNSSDLQERLFPTEAQNEGHDTAKILLNSA